MLPFTNSEDSHKTGGGIQADMKSKMIRNVKKLKQ